MPHPPLLYGFDLSTNAGPGPVDATKHRITRIGLSTPTGDDVFEGDEGEILHLFDHRIAVLPPGVLVTWQGSLLDFPLMVRRARHHQLGTGIRLRDDHRPAPPSMLVGVDHPSCSDWYSHRHLELRRFYDTGARWWDPMRDKLDPSSESSTAPDVCRFARLARVLAVRRWEQASRFVDRMPEPASWTPPSESPHVRESGIAGDNHSAVL